MNILVIGAGFSGAVIARELAENGYLVKVVDKRSHIGGNCHTERDEDTGIMVHKYGPHIFHTDDYEVWEYVRKFGEFEPFINRVKVRFDNRIFSLPINLHTINQFFDKDLTPSQAKEFLNELADHTISEPGNFEEQALKMIGRELYEAFLKGYTEKQWGLSPTKLPASILKRLPLRFDYNDNYFNHKFQGIPKHGYTAVINNMLDHKNISVCLNERYIKNEHSNYIHIFYSGAIDEWFNYKFGELGYRTLDFMPEYLEGDFQGCAVINESAKSIPYTRTTEHKHFSPWENHERSIIFREYSRNCEKGDIPYYPIRMVDDKNMLNKYLNLALVENGVSFIGRLGTYRYLDMDVTIREALDVSKRSVQYLNCGKSLPSFFIDPF